MAGEAFLPLACRDVPLSSGWSATGVMSLDENRDEGVDVVSDFFKVSRGARRDEPYMAKAGRTIGSLWDPSFPAFRSLFSISSLRGLSTDQMT